jgi:hypothetical protein
MTNHPGKPYLMILTATILLLVNVPVTLAEDASAREIMTKVDQRDDGDNRISDMQMVLIDKQQNERVRTIRSFTKDFGKDIYRAMFFLEPADVQNTAFLTYDYKDTDKDDDQWLYLPALHKSKRIASSDKSGSFMGSDFTYSDMTSIQLEDYDFTLQKEIEVGGHKAWVIQAQPRNDDVVKETGYSKSLHIVRQDNYVIIRAVHWEDKSNHLKYMDVRKLERIDNIWTPTEIHMTTKAGKTVVHKTILKFNNTEYNKNLSENLFTVRQLEKGL